MNSPVLQADGWGGNGLERHGRARPAPQRVLHREDDPTPGTCAIVQSRESEQHDVNLDCTF